MIKCFTSGHGHPEEGAQNGATTPLFIGYEF